MAEILQAVLKHMRDVILLYVVDETDSDGLNDFANVKFICHDEKRVVLTRRASRSLGEPEDGVACTRITA